MKNRIFVLCGIALAGFVLGWMSNGRFAKNNRTVLTNNSMLFPTHGPKEIKIGRPIGEGYEYSSVAVGNNYTDGSNPWIIQVKWSDKDFRTYAGTMHGK